MHCVTVKVSVTQIHYLETHPQEATEAHGHKCEEPVNHELKQALRIWTPGLVISELL